VSSYLDQQKITQVNVTYLSNIYLFCKALVLFLKGKLCVYVYEVIDFI